MNRFHVASIFCITIGIIFFIIGFLKGEVEAGLIIIIPFISGSGIFAFLGFILIFLGVIIYLFSFNYYQNQYIEYLDKENLHDRSNKKSIKGGGVILIGPIPIIFGSSKKIALIMMIIAIILIIVTFILLF